ncbi:SDR family oxidoreductase [Bifidobacterium callimiconis]|uniref:SDR family oxidoreductase n=1 Tax=Bifidobacterium callimiconis TaxID=2306973 RepID=UPI001BDBDC4C|nr:SDR family oxidoreductase [Bifidobacterium callimiconis]MBT1176097.1 SDR family oxidoreductase [Bifidobacterium callimiconis]
MTDNRNKRTRVAVVTGAGGGVGGRLVHTLAANGWRVLAVVRKDADVRELDAIDGVQAHLVDLLDAEGIERWTAWVNEHEPDGIDLLANVAAVASVGSIETATADVWDTVLRTNVVAPALLTRGLLPAIRRTRGSIVFVNSGAGERAIPNHAVYASSKHALRALANTIRLEEAGNGVRVGTVYPGQIDTGMLRGIDETLGVEFHGEDYIRPQTVADAIVWIANAPDDVHITNVDLRPRQEVSSSFNV